MNIFETLLEIKTGRKNLPVDIISISNTTWNKDITFVYYYDRVNHSFYINSIKNSSRDCITQIMNQAYKQQMSLFKKQYISKKPKVFNVFVENFTWMLVIERLKLKVSRDKNWNILEFRRCY